MKKSLRIIASLVITIMLTTIVGTALAANCPDGAHSYSQTPSTYSKYRVYDANLHERGTYRVYKCERQGCTGTLVTSVTWGQGYYPHTFGSWVDVGHTGSTHKFSKTCTVAGCAYRKTISPSCGGAPHVLPE